MKTLNKYILFQLIGPFIFTFVLFTFMLFVDLTFTMIEEWIVKGVEISKIFKILLYALPMSIAITIPMAFISSILMVFSRLSGNNEITAMTTNGISILRIIMPVIIVALILSLLMCWFNDTILPQANYALKTLRFQILTSQTTLKIKEHVYIKDFEDLIIYIEKVDHKNSLLYNLTLYSFENRNLCSVIFAKEGTIIMDKESLNLYIYVRNGEIYQKNEDYYTEIKFNSLYKILKFGDSESLMQQISKGSTEMKAKELLAKAKKEKSEGSSIYQYLVEFHKKFAIAFACLAVALIGLPLGITPGKGGQTIGFGISLMLIAVYYVLIITGEILGEKGKIMPLIAMWFPDMLLGGLGIFLVYKKNKGETVFGFLKRKGEKYD